MRPVILAVAAGIAGCAAPPAPPPIGPEAAVPFQCPRAGAAVGYNNSATLVVFSGSDPSDPLICLGTLPDGTKFRRVAGIAVPPGQERAFRDGLAPLFPTASGTMASSTAEFGYFQSYRNDPATGQFRDRWTRLASETLRVGGKPVETTLFEREVNNTQAWGSVGIRWRLWLAPGTGVWVRGEPTLLRGDATLRPFRATSLIVP